MKTDQNTQSCGAQSFRYCSPAAVSAAHSNASTFSILWIARLPIFRNRCPAPSQRHRSSVLGLIFQRAASSVWFKQVSRIFDSFRVRQTVRMGTKASEKMICKSDSYQSSCGFILLGRAQRRFDRSRVPSANCPSESVISIRLRPDFCVVFGGYGGWAVNWHIPRSSESVLSGPIFSGPVAFANWVNFPQIVE